MENPNQGDDKHCEFSTFGFVALVVSLIILFFFISLAVITEIAKERLGIN